MRAKIVTGALFSSIALVAGCTFLISFEEMPTPDAGVVETSRPPPSNADSAPPPVTEVDSGPPIGVADTCDDTFPLDQIKGCEGYQDNGQVCADVANGLTFPAGYDKSADVVTCRKTPPHATCIKHCRGPGGCAHNPAGIPDECDRCAGKANGTHCGSEMAGWPSPTHKLLVTCADDRMTKSAPCTGTCNAKGGLGAAACE